MDKAYDLGALSRRRLPILGMAILHIALYHTYYATDLLPANIFLSVGSACTDTFFLMSGLGLYYSFSKNSSLVSFYKKRIQRLIIPFVIFALPYYYFVFLRDDPSPKGLANAVAKTNIFISGDLRFWFVTAIFIMYLLFPLIYKYFNKYAFSPKSLLALEAACYAMIFAAYALFPDFMSKCRIVFFHIPVFNLGVFLGKYVKDGKKIGKKSTVLLTAFTLSLLYAIWQYYTAASMVHYFPFAIYGVSTALFFAGLDISPALTRLPKIIFEFYGRMSLEFYLIFERIAQNILRIRHISLFWLNLP